MRPDDGLSGPWKRCQSVPQTLQGARAAFVRIGDMLRRSWRPRAARQSENTAVTTAPTSPEPSHRPRRLAGLVRDAALVVLVVLAVRAFHLRDAKSGRAPAFVAQDVAGTPVRVPSADRQPTLVYFWATWCGTCSAMRGNISALADAERVVSIASRSGARAQVAAFARAQGLDYPVVADEQDRLMRAYGVRAFPTAFVVDAAGDIRHVEVGYTTELGLRARMWLAHFL